MYTRILPLLLSPILSFLSLPSAKRLNSLSYFTRVPYIFICWYCLVSVISGFISDIQPFWGLWKQYEIIVTLYLFICVSVHIKYDPSTFKKFLNFLYILCFLMMAWVIYYNLVVKGVDVIRFFFQRLVTNGMPVINAIQLSAICAFGIIYSVANFRSGNTLKTVGKLIFLIVFLVVFVAAKSRTGILAIALVLIIYLISISTPILSKFKILVIVLITGLSVSKEVLLVLRIGDATELATGGGRFSTMYSANSEDAAWPETIDFIKKKWLIGYGSLNMARFVEDKKFAVDNFVLQSLISAGVLGAIFYIVLVITFPFIWIKLYASKIKDKKLFISSAACLCVGLSRAFSTNDLAYNGFGFIMFLCALVYFYNFKRINHRIKRA